MATTAVFAEILVIGLQVEAWIALALFSAFGSGWVDLTDMRDFAALLTVVLLAVAYVLGIIVDRLADTLIDAFEKTKRGRRIKERFSKSQEQRKRPSIATMRMTVMHKSEGMTRFLDYQRSRWRIVRATIFNLAIAAPLAALYVSVRTDHGWPWAVVPLACSLVLIPVTYFAGIRIQDAWASRLWDAYAIVNPKDSAMQPQERDRNEIVAAVCHRGTADAVELLLVRTKGGKRWTFPKGHVKAGERLPDAAAREAREEAGVEGDVETTPFTRYRYPNTRGDEGESIVSAFLLAVTRQQAPAPSERHRNPTWATPDEAIRLLSGGEREPAYAGEHARVVREAVEGLSSAD